MAAKCSTTLLVGATLLAAAVEGSIVANSEPDCSKLYSKQWSGGKTVASQGGFDYTWAFYPCTPALANPNCNQPPYSGNVYLAQMNLRNPNPCVHQLFCEASPASAIRNSTSGVVTYQFPGCIPSQVGGGFSPRSATVHVFCDSPTFKVDPVVATPTSNGGYHFTLRVHGPCGSPPPPPMPPVPSCPAELAHVPALFFTQPLNPKTTGDVYDWGVNLCNATTPDPPMLLAIDSVTGKQTTLDQRVGVVSTSNGWEFHLASSTGPDTGKITVEKPSAGPCRYLSAPEGGVTATANRDLGVQIAMTLKCL